MKSSAALFALATGAFAIGTTEFTPMGLLPVIADGVQVSIPSAGMLISAYAVGVMLGAPVMTLLFARFGKRAALMSLMLIFTVGNLLSAFAPSYSTLLLSRLITSLNHGAFFGIGAVPARRQGTPRQSAFTSKSQSGCEKYGKCKGIRPALKPVAGQAPQARAAQSKKPPCTRHGGFSYWRARQDSNPRPLGS